MTHNSIAGKSKRQLNFELLRIIAMVMVVCLHYFNKGGMLDNPSRDNMSTTGYTVWLIEAFCLVAVNVYVLITGYFGVDEADKNTFKNVLDRPFKVWKQVMFYSLTIGAIAIITGLQQIDIYQIAKYFFPILTEHYWFATYYVLLCLFMPFLNAGFIMLDKKQVRRILATMILLSSMSKTFIPMHLPWDNSGYDVLWFVVVYLTGAYIRKYGAGILSHKYLAIGLYTISSLTVFASFALIRLVYLRTGKLVDFITYGYSYNYLFCYLASIGFFVAFSHVNIKDDYKIRKTIELMSSATFGVYLIHVHINTRDLWTTWFNTEKVASSSVPVFLVCMIGTVAIVYIVCSIIEILRLKACAYINESLKGRRL